MKNTTALFLIVLAIGLFYTFTKSTYDDAKTRAVTADEYKGVLANLDAIVEARDRLIINYNSISKAEIERLSKALPMNVDTVRLALDLDTIASRYGISISDVTLYTGSEQNSSEFSVGGTGTPYEKVEVLISFVSNYENFRLFLEDLEKSLRIMDVKGLNFQVGENSLYEHSVLISTYWVK